VCKLEKAAKLKFLKISLGALCSFFLICGKAIREALRLFEAYQATQTSHLQALRADIHQGLADVDAKRVGVLDVEVIKQQGRQRLNKQLNK